ncbi:hypothetical protein BJ138DRAFT_344112 [Hygrophoropsis aurantiaca]|uniref:Uncharacterized protein n=1 Tax=Hygrophoropsis aurantiaca TaxID=72124 RepID=A0ACB8A568_9AGAM|nr:hypothetical protein BJ138DRAFT_344112 [Hygrophoropsis aurantiaca]
MRYGAIRMMMFVSSIRLLSPGSRSSVMVLVLVLVSQLMRTGIQYLETFVEAVPLCCSFFLYRIMSHCAGSGKNWFGQGYMLAMMSVSHVPFKCL